MNTKREIQRKEDVVQAVAEEAIHGHAVVWAFWDLDPEQVRADLVTELQQLQAPADTLGRIKLAKVKDAAEADTIDVPQGATFVRGWKPGCFER